MKFAVAGAFAGTFATLVAIPADVVTTRIQTEITVPKELRKYRNIFIATKRIFQDEGPKAFIRGLGPRLIQTIPAASITFTIYEKIKKLLKAF